MLSHTHTCARARAHTQHTHPPTHPPTRTPKVVVSLLCPVLFEIVPLVYGVTLMLKEPTGYLNGFMCVAMHSAVLYCTVLYWYRLARERLDGVVLYCMVPHTYVGGT